MSLASNKILARTATTTLRALIRHNHNNHNSHIHRRLSLASSSRTTLSGWNNKGTKTKAAFGGWNLRTMAFSTKEGTSLADQVMSAKKAQKEEDKDKEEEDKKKGPKPVSKWQTYGYIFFAVVVGGGTIVNCILFALPDKDEAGNVIRDEFSDLPFYSQYFLRLKNKVVTTKKDMEDPFSDKLLPDPLPEPYIQPKYTILMELTGLLVHANWTHKHGWRFQKRPGVDMFMSQIGYPHFELVIYTKENAMTFNPIVDGLDPSGQFIMYRLFRDATRYLNGQHTKDLSAMNRDLKKVILVDWNSDSVVLNSDNALLLKKWEGDNSDKSLIGLAQLLQAIKQSDVDDVREVLSYYRQFDDPIEAFRENQRRLQSEMAAEEEKKQKQQQQKSSFLSGFAGFGGGVKKST